MNTTYKMIYKALNDNGKIDEIINKYSKDENIQIVKADIIFGIEMAVDLFNSDMFTKMKYWFERPTELKYIITKDIEREYGKIKLEEIEKDKKYFEYMLTMIE